MSERLSHGETACALEVKKGGLSLVKNITRELIAHVSFHRINANDEHPAQLMVRNFDTEPDFQGKGFGKLLMHKVIDILEKEQREGVLSVHADNSRARAFYESLGWEYDEDYTAQLNLQRGHAHQTQFYMVYTPESLRY